MTILLNLNTSNTLFWWIYYEIYFPDRWLQKIEISPAKHDNASVANSWHKTSSNKILKKKHVYVTFAYEVISQHHWLKWLDHICLQFTSIYSDTDSSPMTYSKFKLHKWRNTVPYRLLPCNLAYKPLQEISQAAVCRCYFKIFFRKTRFGISF